MRRPGLIAPVILIAIGALFLFGNLGVIPPVSGRCVLSLWPLLLIVVGIGALIGSERPNLALGLQLAVMGISLALLAGSGSFDRTVQGASTAIPGAPEVVVTASELRFSPDEISLPSTVVNLTLRNDGVLSHDLTIPALGVRIAADSGTASTAGLRDLLRGRHEAYCGIPGHHDAGMRMTVTVE